MMKQCPVCGREFHTWAHRKKYCDECRPEVDREIAHRYYQAHREQYRQYARKYYEEHREQVIAAAHRNYVASKLAVLKGEKSA